MKTKVAVFGLSANPPQMAHFAIIRALANSSLCDGVMVVPCGERSDKPDFVPGRHRLAMTELLCREAQSPTGGEIWVNRIDVFHEHAMPTIELMDQLAFAQPAFQHQVVVGTDLLIARDSQGGLCDVETWEGGERLMKHWPFLITKRPGVPIDALRLPAHYDFVDAEFPNISSTNIRARVPRGDAIEEFVLPSIAQYIHDHNLYQPKEQQP